MTFPLAIKFLPIGDVVTVAPSRKELDPYIRASIELSGFTFHCFSVGTPAVGGCVLTGLLFLGLGLEDGLLVTSLFDSSLELLLPPKKPPNNDPLDVDGLVSDDEGLAGCVLADLSADAVLSFSAP
jgi:hypothetical protein